MAICIANSTFGRSGRPDNFGLSAHSPSGIPRLRASHDQIVGNEMALRMVQNDTETVSRLES
jgi:hypothetical protein